MKKFVEAAAMPLIRYASRSYVAGENAASAARLAETASQHGFSSTLCYWNDGREAPDLVARRYHEAIDTIDKAQLDSYLALKIPALWDNFDLAAEIVAHARACRVTVVLDSHAPEQADANFAFIEKVGPDGMGCAIPGRWQRSAADAERAIALGIQVRVVKGQWVDPQQPDIDLRAGYLALIDQLAGRATHVGVATHDGWLARQAFDRLRAAQTSCEQELVYPDPTNNAVDVAVDADIPSRLYIPFGTAWLPYSVSRAARKPEVLLWLVKDLFTSNRFQMPTRRSSSDGRAQ
jgi:proline dehydrogenase